jgi:hypothetical protein
VGGIIRLNDLLYDVKAFQRENVKVHGLEFPDGSNPSDQVIAKFNDMAD